MRASDYSAQRGFTLIHVLLLTALLTGSVASIAPRFAFEMARERELLLLEVGSRYEKALKEYYDASPGNQKLWPARLEDLLRDKRYVGMKRHLRKLEADPVNPGRPWSTVRDSKGGIIGVYSTSSARPLSDGGGRFGGANAYSDWKFIAKDAQP